ncbi:hypothetical protein [Mariniflexile maritimum]|uniref:hypothetical protein n=1 Tax=Mariniflexile maritimum TaxID=2682493 RepID=UPI001E467F72|nr:hypothetical protein [Mariniflexile maritimum]
MVNVLFINSPEMVVLFAKLSVPLTISPPSYTRVTPAGKLTVLPCKSITQLITTVALACTASNLKSQGVLTLGATGSVSVLPVDSSGVVGTTSVVGSTNNSSLLHANNDSVKKKHKNMGLMISFISSRFGIKFIMGLKLKLIIQLSFK